MTVADERQRPQIYLDQNVLDVLVDEKNGWLEKAILQIGEVFYSNETLAEIHRSGEGAMGFLEVLARLNARYISTNTNQRGELIDNSATLSDIASASMKKK